MRVIPPLAITDAVLTSSTAAEPHATEDPYVAGTTYALGAVVVVAADHRKYESLQSGNTGHTPISSPAWWFDVGPSNRWAMLDLLRNTKTVQASPLTVVLTPGVRINSVVLLGLEATSVTVTMTSGATVVYTHTDDLNTREVANWYDYFFEPFGSIPSVALFDLPPFSGATLTVTITNTTGDSACSGIVIGSHQYIGEAQQEAESETLGFSTFDRDEFGNVTLIPRRSVPTANITVVTEKAIINAVRNLRADLEGTPAFWSTLDDATSDWFESFALLGVFRKFAINSTYPDHAVLSLEIEEL